MKIVVETNPVLTGGQYYVARLEATDTDYALFHTASTMCTREKTWREVPNLKEIWAATTTPEASHNFWRNHFMAQGDVHFVLMKTGDSAEDHITGMADINVSCNPGFPSPVFSGLHVLKAHRGKQLSDFLHAARSRHAVYHMTEPTADIFIYADNEPAIKAAQRAGFALAGTGSRGFGERRFLIYRCDLQSLRPKPSRAPEAALEMNQPA